jgi:hypothetical protein
MALYVEVRATIVIRTAESKIQPRNARDSNFRSCRECTCAIVPFLLKCRRRFAPVNREATTR